MSSVPLDHHSMYLPIGRTSPKRSIRGRRSKNIGKKSCQNTTKKCRNLTDVDDLQISEWFLATRCWTDRGWCPGATSRFASWGPHLIWQIFQTTSCKHYCMMSEYISTIYSLMLLNGCYCQLLLLVICPNINTNRYKCPLFLMGLSRSSSIPHMSVR